MRFAATFALLTSAPVTCALVILAVVTSALGAQTPRDRVDKAKPITSAAVQPPKSSVVMTKPEPAKPEAAKPDPAPKKAAESPKPPAPLQSETLRLNLNWPSGLSLGEGELTSSLSAEGWSFAVKLDAAIPAFPIAESATSRSGADLCSTELVREATRGRRKVGEKTTFDAVKLTAIRKTTNMPDGGKTEVRINGCAKDALTFIHFLRRELAAGRIPQAQPVYYGAGYQTRVQYVGTQRIRAGNEMVEADKLNAFIKGPASEFTVELFFARDAARTPLFIHVPVAIGKFTVEFER